MKISSLALMKGIPFAFAANNIQIGEPLFQGSIILEFELFPYHEIPPTISSEWPCIVP